MARRGRTGQAIRAMGTGTGLVVVGVGGYLGSGRASATALIPAALGAPMVGLGAVGLLPVVRRLSLPATTVLAVAAAAGTARSVTKIPALVRGEDERPAATVAQLVTFGLSAGYLLRSRRS